MTPLAWLITFLIAIPLLLINDAQETKKRKQAFDALYNDKSQPETDRRKKLVRDLIAKGNTILNQDEGIVQYKHPKSGFSWLMFIVLFICGVLPAVIYLIWYSTQKEKISSITLEI